jgi:hypothetical protein
MDGGVVLIFFGIEFAGAQDADEFFDWWDDFGRHIRRGYFAPIEDEL